MWKIKAAASDATFHLNGKTVKGADLAPEDISALIAVYDNPKTSPSGLKQKFFEYVTQPVTAPTKPTATDGK